MIRKRDDLKAVKIIRAVSQRLVDEVDTASLQSDGKTKDELYRHYVVELCNLVVRQGGISHFFGLKRRRSRWGPLSDYALITAAAYLNMPSLVKRLLRPDSEYSKPHYPFTQLFGTPLLHVLQHDNLDLLKCFPALDKMKGLGAYYGSLQCTNYIYERRSSTLMKLLGVNSRPRPSPLSFITPSISIFEFMVQLWHGRELRPKPPGPPGMMDVLLHTCAMENWVTMARYLFASHDAAESIDESNVNARQWYGTEGVSWQHNTPLEIACMYGHVEMAELLYLSGANVKGALKRAAYYGHIEVVARLLDLGVKIPCKIVQRAVRVGNLPLAKLLLEHGARASDGAVHPLVQAVAAEHVPLFELLLQHGVVLDQRVRLMCVEKAEEEGLESMCEYLERYTVTGAEGGIVCV